MINKIAHIVWIGWEMPKSQKKIVDRNMEILKKQGFVIALWDNDSIAEYFSRIPDWVIKAMLEKKYAIAVDYFRVQLVNNFWGIYIDCDHELIKPIPDYILYSDIFIWRLPSWFINNSFFWAKKWHKLIRTLIRTMKKDINVDNMIVWPRVESLFLFWKILDIPCVTKVSAEEIYPYFPWEKTTWITYKTFAISWFTYSWSNKWYLRLCNKFWLKRLSLFIRNFTDDHKHF